jgi:hypothetical protein
MDFQIKKLTSGRLCKLLLALGHLYKLPSALADGQIHKWKQALAKNSKLRFNPYSFS